MSDQVFSSIDFVGQCLVDKERTDAFQKAIKNAITKNSTVLDLGTGSGVMALFAAKNGAKKVTAVEFDPFVASIAKKNFNFNGFKKKISLLVEDARKLRFAKNQKFTVVVSEMLTTGIVDEHQVQAINNLHNQKLVDKNTVFIPQQQNTFISLMNADMKLHGLEIPMTLHLWRWHDWKSLKLKSMSKNILLNSLDFRSVNDEKFNKVIEILVSRSGIINALYLTSESILDDTAIVKDTEALNAPMLIPIQEKKVEAGQKIKIKIKYTFGGSYSNFEAKAIE
jgi:predicted RNA methylase